jgi:SAM-dependent methyltransferase
MIKQIIYGLWKRGLINTLKVLYSRYWFQLRYGINMNLSTGQAGVEQANPKESGHVRYEPICHFSFNRMMEHLEWNFRESTFIDYGCGKGAAILLASRFGFQKYFGVEYSAGLVKDCKSNIRKFMKRSGRVMKYEIFCGDATTHIVPPEVNVVYFFNPFDSKLMDAVLQNIEQSLTSRKRDILLLYFNALHKDVIERYGYTPVYDEKVDKINIWYLGGNYAYIKRAS